MRPAGLPVRIYVASGSQYNMLTLYLAGGTNYGSAIASTDNAETFWSQGVCGMLDWGVNVFYFEAFDEPNKGTATGDDGSVSDETHWGAYTSDRVAKWTLTC